MIMNKMNVAAVIALLLFAVSVPIKAQKNLVGGLQLGAPQNATEFDSANAFSDGNGAWIRWQMKAEQNNLGFYVHRVSEAKSEIANPNFIGGGYFLFGQDIAVGQIYTFYDPLGSIGASYVIETLAVNGQRTTSEKIYAEYVESLLNFAGRTSQELKSESAKTDYRVERNEFVLSKEMQREIGENALPPDLNKHRLVASQPGVKLGTKKEGIYRVSRAELQSAGFDVNLPSENWQLYMNGNEQSMIVENGGNYIEFYGQGIDTPESGTQIYFLINGNQAGKRIENTVRRRISASVISKSYDQSFYKSDRVSYITQIRNGDASNFFDHIINTSGVNVNFTLNEIDPEVSNSVVTVKVQGLTLTTHNVNVMINGTFLGQLTGNSYDLMTGTYQIPTSVLIEGTNTLNFRVPASLSDICLVESIRVNFARRYVAQQNRLSFYAKPNKQFEVTNFSSAQIRVFDTTYPDSPSMITNLTQTSANGRFGFTVPANRGKRMFAVAEDAILPIDSIAENTPSSLSTTNHNARLVIISHKDWMTESQAWATYRMNQGYSVETVRVDDIFDEFNYGIVSANAIRSFLLYAKNNWNTPPEYVLITGDASFDPRGYTTAPDVNYVPTKLFDTAYEETGSDEAMADFDNDGLSEMAIGRITAKNGGDVSQSLARAVIFEQTSAQGFSRGALFVSDLPLGYDFAAMNQRLSTELPPGTPITFINRGDVDSRPNLLTQLNFGRFVINYSGHGAFGLWAHSSFYTVADVPGMSNGTNYGIFTMLTCLNGYFINPFADSLSEFMMKAPNGGSVAVWASSGKTTPDVQEVLARRFYRMISVGSIPRMGDLIRDAKQNVVGARDVRLSWTLIGDPLLKVR